MLRGFLVMVNGTNPHSTFTIQNSTYLCSMCKEDEAFVQYWAANREQEKKSVRPLLVGMSSGIAIGVLILISLSSGWYERANMVANTSFSTPVFLLAVLLFSLFMAIIYRKFRWEMKEQRYLELLAKKEAAEKAGKKQLSP